MDAVHVGGLGGTYGGNPVACAAALGAIAEMREHDLAGRARAIGELMRGRLDALPPSTPSSATSAAAARCWPSSSCAPGTTEPDAGRRRRGVGVLPRSAAWSP